MIPKAQTVTNKDLKVIGYSENDAINALQNELVKGVQSMKNGEVYTVEEAWEEIDKI